MTPADLPKRTEADVAALRLRHDLVPSDSDLVTLLFTCVGVPEYLSRAGGGPGAPVAIRPVVPRLGDSTYERAFLRQAFAVLPGVGFAHE